MSDTVPTKLEDKVDGMTRMVVKRDDVQMTENLDDATKSIAVSVTRPIPSLIPKPIPTSIPAIQNQQSKTQSSGDSRLKV